MAEVSSLAATKAHLSELVARVGDQHERITVTVHGRPVAVLLAVDDLELLEETIAVLLSSPAAKGRTRAALPRRCVNVELEHDPGAIRVGHRPHRPQATNRSALAAHQLIIGRLLGNPQRIGSGYDHR